jgi:hypothetical protein
MKNENMCSNNGGAQGKKKIGRNLVYHQNQWFFKFHPLLNVNVFFYRFKEKIHLLYDQIQGFGVLFFLLYG